jgi:hypothetical protein
LKRVLDLTAVPTSPALKSLRKKCLAPNDLGASMELAEQLQKASIQGLVFRALLLAAMTTWSFT